MKTSTMGVGWSVHVKASTMGVEWSVHVKASTMGVGWSVHAPWEWGGAYMHHGSGVECTCTM